MNKTVRVEIPLKICKLKENKKTFISYGLNTTLMVLVHPYTEETEVGKLLDVLWR